MGFVIQRNEIAGGKPMNNHKKDIHEIVISTETVLSLGNLAKCSCMFQKISDRDILMFCFFFFLTM